jgi:hypothetical protein
MLGEMDEESMAFNETFQEIITIAQQAVIINDKIY